MFSSMCFTINLEVRQMLHGQIFPGQISVGHLSNYKVDATTESGDVLHYTESTTVE